MHLPCSVCVHSRSNGGEFQTKTLRDDGIWEGFVGPFLQPLSPSDLGGPVTFSVGKFASAFQDLTGRRITSVRPCLVYFDDIIKVRRTFEEHLNNIRKVFQRLQRANLKLSPKKCRFFRKEVSYLGHIISSDGVKTDPEKTKTEVDWPRPATVHDLRSFLGLCTYYRRFVRNFSAIAKPLHKLTEARSDFNWTEECEKSFSSLKPILEKKLNSEDRPSWQEIAPESPATKRYWALWDSLHLKDGVLYRKFESDDGSSCRWQLILPQSRNQEILQETHDSASGGHFGIMKTLRRIRERFYWDRLCADVEKWCRECQICRARKRPNTEDRKSVTEWISAEKISDRTPRFPCDILFGRPGDTPSSPNEDLNKLEARLESVQTSDRELVKLSKVRKRTHYDSRVTDHHFKKGDLVWVCNPKQRRGLSPKPRQKCEGPYTAVKKLNDVVYRVQRSPKVKPKVIHINRLVPYWTTDHSSI
ncbi:Retrovirus-related Pol polyprotein from transposon 297 [Araneus ventricosus]|uniref:RNA-directed DNA polymerase n=1 Tax=Araneus ventricosus TaxID=182803 RepID=A0A4Y2H0I1_ARAVE|nr:Retrovirus-related Pol polyprotein from transposon 297 [Araneus ventricosus]